MVRTITPPVNTDVFLLSGTVNYIFDTLDLHWEARHCRHGVLGGGLAHGVLIDQSQQRRTSLRQLVRLIQALCLRSAMSAVTVNAPRGRGRTAVDRNR